MANAKSGDARQAEQAPDEARQMLGSPTAFNLPLNSCDPQFLCITRRNTVNSWVLAIWLLL